MFECGFGPGSRGSVSPSIDRGSSTWQVLGYLGMCVLLSELRVLYIMSSAMLPYLAIGLSSSRTLRTSRELYKCSDALHTLANA